MALPKEPRQQMITMMYLVLTAMLALNVSAEILKAFNIINLSLEKTNSIFIDKNDDTFNRFQALLENNPERTQVHFDKAKLARTYSAELTAYLQDLRTLLIDKAGNGNGQLDDDDYFDPETKRVKKEDNTDYSSQIFLVEQQGKRGAELKAMINQTREKLLALIQDEHRDNIRMTLSAAVDPPMTSGVQKTWQEENFGEMPLTAAITLLTKYESDVKASEAEVLTYLIDQVGAQEETFDRVRAMVVPRSEYVMAGTDYEADIFVSAWNSTKTPQVIIGHMDTATGVIAEDARLVPVEFGKGKLRIKASGVGEKDFSGYIKVEDPGGSGFNLYPFATAYTVTKPQSVVSPTKMNVMYIGVDNPLSISAAGVESEDVIAAISDGRLIRQADGNYFARVTRPGFTSVTVSTRKDDQTLPVGKHQFRVMRVPDPVGMVGKYESGKVPAGYFKVQAGVQAVLKGFVFDFKYTVVSYDLLYKPHRQDLMFEQNKGPVFGTRIKAILSNAKPKDRVYIENIRVRGDDGSVRRLPTLSFELI